MEITLKKGIQAKAKTNKTKLCMRQKYGSKTVLSVYVSASVVIFLQFIIALSYVLYMSLKITEFEV